MQRSRERQPYAEIKLEPEATLGARFAGQAEEEHEGDEDDAPRADAEARGLEPCESSKMHHVRMLPQRSSLVTRRLGA